MDLFDEYQIPATWAVVGHLFLDECDGVHAKHPTPPEWFEHERQEWQSRPEFRFGGELIGDLLNADADHDIGSHTFSHVLFDEDWVTPDVPLVELYRAYQRNMQRIDGTVYPRSFFATLAEHVPNRTMTFTATRDGEVVGRYLHLLDEEQSSLRYFFAAIADESHYEYNVSEVLHERAMQWGTERGYRTYDFGATGADYADGLFKYKAQYGGDIVPVLRWQRSMSPLAWPLYKLGRHVYQQTRY